MNKFNKIAKKLHLKLLDFSLYLHDTHLKRTLQYIEKVEKKLQMQQHPCPNYN
jgi:hypothetical protein